MRHRSRSQLTALLLVLMISGAAAAFASIVLDGQVGDWGALPPVATDAKGDSSAGDPAEDLVAAFLTTDGVNVYFRMDVNLSPSPETFTTLEDTPLTIAAGALTANDGNFSMLAGFQQPAYGMLNSMPDGSLEYVPNVDFSGTDAFTYTVNSPSGLVRASLATISVQEVNDAPTYTLGANLKLVHNPGAVMLTGWASGFSPGPGSESAQTLMATVRVLDVPGNTLSFAVSPSLDISTGTLSFTPTTDSVGTALIQVVLKDNGGTAFGGVDTTTKTFTIHVNIVPVAVGQSLSRPPGSCLPTTLLWADDDLDFYSTVPLGVVWVKFKTLPENGFLVDFVADVIDAVVLPDGASASAHANVAAGPLCTQPTEGTPTLYGTSHAYLGGPELWAHTTCYIPFSSTFIGVDSFEYSIIDECGDESNTVTTTIQIFED